jgi:hypothetical protein
MFHSFKHGKGQNKDLVWVIFYIRILDLFGFAVSLFAHFAARRNRASGFVLRI